MRFIAKSQAPQVLQAIYGKHCSLYTAIDWKVACQGVPGVRFEQFRCTLSYKNGHQKVKFFNGNKRTSNFIKLVISKLQNISFAPHPVLGHT